MTISKKYFFLILLSGIVFISTSFYLIDNVSLSQEELELYDMINSYRKKNGLHKVELSKSLTYVAKIHAKDLEENDPNNKRCNMHSWSENGKWEGC
ncbi:MAG: hypothetical protein K8R41_07555, partial [Bacteroidales bacterium]|nr:hypothetical protein [Bacteroidales bacterium]